MTYISSRPIAAYSMSDFENLNSADFKRGKDKKKRKRRGGMIAAGIGAGALGAGAVGGGLYAYGSKGTKTTKKTSSGSVTQRTASPIQRRMNAQTNAFGATIKELKEAKNYAGRKAAIKDLGSNIKGILGETGRGIKVGAGKLAYNIGATKEGYGQLRNAVGEASILAGAGKKGFKRGASQIYAAGKAALGTKTGRLAGLAGAGALAGGGYAAYKAMKKRKNRD
jgi:hypothetical protein